MKSKIEVNISDDKLFLEANLCSDQKADIADKMLAMLLRGSVTSTGIMSISCADKKSFIISPVGSLEILEVTTPVILSLSNTPDKQEKIKHLIQEIANVLNNKDQAVTVPAGNVDNPIVYKGPEPKLAAPEEAPGCEVVEVDTVLDNKPKLTKK